MSTASTESSSTDRLILIGETPKINDIGRFARHCILHGATDTTPDDRPRNIWEVRPEEEGAFFARSTFTPDEMRATIANFRAQTQEVLRRALDPLQLTRDIAEKFYGIDLELHPDDWQPCPFSQAHVTFASTGPTSTDHICTPATATVNIDWTNFHVHVQEEADYCTTSEEESGTDEEGG